MKLDKLMEWNEMFFFPSPTFCLSEANTFSCKTRLCKIRALVFIFIQLQLPSVRVVVYCRKDCDSLKQYLEDTMGPISQSFTGKRVLVDIVRDSYGNE